MSGRPSVGGAGAGAGAGSVSVGEWHFLNLSLPALVKAIWQSMGVDTRDGAPSHDEIARFKTIFWTLANAFFLNGETDDSSANALRNLKHGVQFAFKAYPLELKLHGISDGYKTNRSQLAFKGYALELKLHGISDGYKTIRSQLASPHETLAVLLTRHDFLNFLDLDEGFNATEDLSDRLTCKIKGLLEGEFSRGVAPKRDLIHKLHAFISFDSAYKAWKDAEGIAARSQRERVVKQERGIPLTRPLSMRPLKKREFDLTKKKPGSQQSRPGVIGQKRGLGLDGLPHPARADVRTPPADSSDDEAAAPVTAAHKRRRTGQAPVGGAAAAGGVRAGAAGGAAGMPVASRPPTLRERELAGLRRPVAEEGADQHPLFAMNYKQFMDEAHRQAGIVRGQLPTPEQKRKVESWVCEQIASFFGNKLGDFYPHSGGSKAGVAQVYTQWRNGKRYTLNPIFCDIKGQAKNNSNLACMLIIHFACRSFPKLIYKQFSRESSKFFSDIYPLVYQKMLHQNHPVNINTLVPWLINLVKTDARFAHIPGPANFPLLVDWGGYPIPGSDSAALPPLVIEDDDSSSDSDSEGGGGSGAGAGARPGQRPPVPYRPVALAPAAPPVATPFRVSEADRARVKKEPGIDGDGPAALDDR